LFFYLSLFAKMLYYLCTITYDLLPLGYYPEATLFRLLAPFLRACESSNRTPKVIPTRGESVY